MINTIREHVFISTYRVFSPAPSYKNEGERLYSCHPFPCKNDLHPLAPPSQDLPHMTFLLTRFISLAYACYTALYCGTVDVPCVHACMSAVFLCSKGLCILCAHLMCVSLTITH